MKDTKCLKHAIDMFELALTATVANEAAIAICAKP
jgi:hypothetical protein